MAALSYQTSQMVELLQPASVASQTLYEPAALVEGLRFPLHSRVVVVLSFSFELPPHLIVGQTLPAYRS